MMYNNTRKIFLGAIFMFICLGGIYAQNIKVGIGHNGSITSLVMIHDGQVVASASSDGSIKIWEGISGREIRTLTGHEDQITSMSVNQGNTHLVTSGRDTTTRLWDIETGTEIWQYKGNDASFAVAFHPKGKIVAAADSDKIRILDAITGKLLRTLTGHYYWIRDLAFSPDGERLYSCSDDETIIAWNVQTGLKSWSKRGHNNAVTSLVLSPDGKRLYTSSTDKSLKVWNAVSGAVVQEWKTITHVIHGMVFNAAGNILFIGDASGTVWKVDLPGEHQPVVLKSFEKAISSMVYLLNGTLVIGFSNAEIAEFATDEKDSTKYYGAGIGQILDFSLAKHTGLISVASSDGSLGIWNPEEVKLQQVNSLPRAVLATAISQDGKIVAYSDTTGDICIRNSESNNIVWTLSKHTKGVNGLSISPDGSRLLSGSSDGTIGYWDLKKGTLIKMFIGPIGEIKDVQFGPEGNMGIAGDAHNEIFIINLKDLVLSFPLYINNYGVSSVCFSPDGEKFVSTAIDQLDSTKNNVHVWNRKTMSQLYTVKGHTDGALASAFSFDGKTIATGGNDNVIRLWNTATGSSKGNFIGHTNSITDLEFFDKGGRLMSSSRDGTIKLWDSSGNVAASFLFTKENEWLIWTEEGFFTGTDWAMKHMVYIIDGMKTYSIDQFFEIFYRPDLVAAKVRGVDISSFAPDININELLKKHGHPPLVEIISPAQGEARLRKVKIRFRVSDQGGGIGKVLVFINNSPIIISDNSGRGLQIITKETSPHNKSGSSIEYEALLTLSPGENKIIVTAYNKMNTIESNPPSLTLRLGKVEFSKPKLHLLTIAVEKYRDRALQLKYTVDDATAMVQALENQGELAGGLYESVHIYTLLDAEVTKEKFMNKFNEISKKISPDDLFILFFAGHGVTHESDGEYYFLPVDFRYKNSESIVELGISKEDILNSLILIPAQKSVILFDTCNSGAFLDKPISRGLSEKTAIDRLLRGVGRAMIMASADDQVALEGYENHGVFTYIVLQGMSGKADANNDNYITIKELSLYIESTVPDVTFNKWGYEQVPQSNLPHQDFPVIVK